MSSASASATPTPANQATLYAGFAAGYLIAFRASDGTVRWRTKGYTASPVVSDGVLYTASGADLVALRPQSDGVAEVWRTPLDTTALTSTPVLSNGILYVNTSGLTANRSAPNGSVFAVDANTGHILWRFQTHGSMFGAPVVTADAVYTGAEPASLMSTLFALNRADGALRWRVQRKEYVTGMAVLGGTIYVGSTDNTVAAFRVSNGAQLWSYRTPGFVDSLAVSTIGEASIVFAGSRDETLYALRASDGTLLWTYQADGFILAPVVVQGDLVYITSEHGYLAVLDAATGSVRWRTCVDHDTCTDPGGAIRFSTLLVAGQTIYVGAAFVGTGPSAGLPAEEAGGIYVLDANAGHVLWQYQSGIVGAEMGTPALADG
ncbi:MAG TPA: PQQ-binding-like beta-propeller repeat protein [Ktedonobacterales bacterium]